MLHTDQSVRSVTRCAMPLVLAAITLAGCATGGPTFQPAEVTLERVEVDHLSVGRQVFTLGFSVSNPNPFPLPVRAIRYELRLADRRVARGETADRFTVGARSAGQFAIDVELDMADSLSHLGFAMLKEPVGYELFGSLTVDLPFASPVAFSTSGRVDLASGAGVL